MAFSELELKRIEKAVSSFFVKRLPPSHDRKKLDFGYNITGQSVVLAEIRPQWDDPDVYHEYPFAKATYVKTKNAWKVFWRRADLKWHVYEPVPEALSIKEFLEVVDNDKHRCFFG